MGDGPAGDEASAPEPCIGGDPTCPCQDGDPCHYRTYGDSHAWAIPRATAAGDGEQG